MSSNMTEDDWRMRLEWYRSAERKRLQRQQADAVADRGRSLFVMIGLPAVALAFGVESVAAGWARYALIAGFVALGATLLVKIVLLMIEHEREVKRIDDDGVQRITAKEGAR
jgi:hypothetical protein